MRQFGKTLAENVKNFSFNEDKESNITSSGYKLANDGIDRQMAYIFGGKTGKESAEVILQEAKELEDKLRKELEEKIERERQENNNNLNPEILEKEREEQEASKEKNIKSQVKDFIEKEVKQYSFKKDEGIKDGIAKIAKGFPAGKGFSGLASNATGNDPASQIFNLLTEKLGLNIDQENCAVSCEKSPPPPPISFQMKIVTVIKPTALEAGSPVNGLAEKYKEQLGDGEKEEFEAKWQEHQTHFAKGGPKIGQKEFGSIAKEAFDKTTISSNSKEHLGHGEMIDKQDEIKTAFAGFDQQNDLAGLGDIDLSGLGSCNVEEDEKNFNGEIIAPTTPIQQQSSSSIKVR